MGPSTTVIEGNGAFAEHFAFGDLPAGAAKRLAVLTCMDSRIDPLRMLGLAPGDAKILRNAGARVTDDVLRTVVVARYLLGVARFMVIAHTNCAMAAGNEESIHTAIEGRGGPDTRSLQFLTAEDQEAALRDDVEAVGSFPFLAGLTAGGFVYNLDTGRLRRVC